VWSYVGVELASYNEFLSVSVARIRGSYVGVFNCILIGNYLDVGVARIYVNY